MKQKSVLTSAIALAALVLVVAGCARFTGSPTKSMNAFYQAARNRDTATMKKYISKDGLDWVEKKAKDEKKSTDDFLNDNNLNRPDAPKEPTLRNEKIDGNTATLEAKFINEDRWETIPFVKEDGDWKIAFDKMMNR